tara:strand:+ start:303 stop:413 length:111 start_codon:yes stop_codon:yes gene_type:complete
MAEDMHTKALRLRVATILWALAISLVFSAAFYLQGT